MALYKLTTEIFIERSNKVHNFKYDYGPSIYTRCAGKVKICCKGHGIFEQHAGAHLKGQGCPLCANIKKGHGKSNKTSHKDFISRSNIIHNNKYTYPEAYVNTGAKIAINCPSHGQFKQTPHNHLNGRGCMDCANEERSVSYRKTTQQFILESNVTHSNKYIYTKVNYINTHTKVIIICPNHGEFIQKPLHHIKGHGCSLCSQGPNVSKIETTWLDYLDIPNEYRQKTLNINGAWKKVDAYDPLTNTIYEFNGDFWHGNPIKYNLNETHPFTKLTYGKMYDNTMNREKLLKEAGYTVISIWEDDWKKQSK